MGGFVLAKSTKDIDVLPLTILALRRMEFRGKDCSGIAWVESGEMRVVKDSFPIAELSSKYALNRVSTSLALGHTRYSTHGKADPRNAHPHLDCERIVAVAGDGALRNYEELYAELVERSHRVVSKSDFELVAHLIENYVRKGLNYTKAFAEAVVRLEGIVAAAALFRDGSAAIYTSHQPVYVGLGRDVVVASSTLSSLYGTVLGYAVVEGGELVFISSGGRVEFADLSGRSVAKKFLAYDLGESLVSTDGYPNHMLREIYEVPYSLLRTVSAVQSRYLELASKVALRSSRLFVIANGTSLHAGHIFSYYLSELAGRIPIVVSASEFPLYYLDSVGVGDAVLAISQSGETSEVVRSVYEARLRGATVIGVTNNINSRLTRFSNLYLPIAAGPELAVPATKTFTSTLVLLYILAKSVSEVSSKPVSKILSEAWREVGEVYRVILSSLDRVRLEAEEASKSISNCSSGYVVSRGITYPLALEGALKIKEAAYLHAEGVEGGELRHGPIAILDRNMFTVFIEPLEPAAASDLMNVAEDVLKYGSPVVLVSHIDEGKERPLAKIRVPSLKRHFMPIGIAVALQLLAYSLARYRGIDVDKPRRLSKVVSTQ